MLHCQHILKYCLTEIIHIKALFGFGFFVNDIQDYGVWATLGDLFYFSVITFTTVGFGEITPIGPLGKFLTIFEGLVSGIIMTIFIIAMYRRLMDR